MSAHHAPIWFDSEEQAMVSAVYFDGGSVAVLTFLMPDGEVRVWPKGQKDYRIAWAPTSGMLRRALKGDES